MNIIRSVLKEIKFQFEYQIKKISSCASLKNKYIVLDNDILNFENKLKNEKLYFVIERFNKYIYI